MTDVPRMHMQMPSKRQVKAGVTDLVTSILLEMILVKVAARLKRGRVDPKPARLRRAFAAVLSEIVAAGATELYWQRRRMSAAFDQHIATQMVQPRESHPVSLPTPRPTDESVPRRSGASGGRTD